MQDGTVVISMSEPGWIVYRVETASSRYYLSLYFGGEGRPIAVLRGTSGQRRIDQADSAPLVGRTVLFDVDPQAWVGQCLEVGRVKTSEIRAVEREKDLTLVRALTSAAITTASGVTSVRAESEPERSYVPVDAPTPYPKNQVSRMERAAAHIAVVYEAQSLIEDLASHADLRQRFEVALGECLMKAQALAARLARSRQ